MEQEQKKKPENEGEDERCLVGWGWGVEEGNEIDSIRQRVFSFEKGSGYFLFENDLSLLFQCFVLSS